MQLSSSLRFSNPNKRENPLSDAIPKLKIGGLFGGLPKTILATEDLYPYFYVEKRELGADLFGDRSILRVEPSDLVSVAGVPVQQAYFSVPSIAAQMAQTLSDIGVRTFESDLRHTRRLLLDKKFQIDYGNRWRFIDIETDDSKNDINLGDFGSIKILSISMSDGKKNDWYYWNDFPGGEKEMLQHFYTKCLDDRIGAFYGWNVKFDVGHIEGRLKHYNLNLPYAFSYLDMLEKYRFEVKGLGSYSLKEVTEHEGMAEKKIHRSTKVSKMSREDLEKYNRRDVDVLATLDEKYGFSMLYNQMARDVNMPLELLSAGNIGDQLILERLRELGKVGINLVEREADSYSGAFVKQPPSGLFRNVGVYDFTALYPNIIIHNNIDILDFNGLVLPYILRNLLAKREEYKALYKKTGDIKYNTMQAAVKPKINALYGLLGYKYARFYDKHKAEFVTTKGRAIIHALINYVENNLGGKVLYTDTDSVFIDLNTLGGARMADYVATVLNTRMKPFELKLEYVLDQMIFPVSSTDGVAPKKRYVGIYQKLDKKSGQMKTEWTIRGLEMRRGDWCMLAKKTQEHVIEMIFEGRNRYEILEYLAEIKRNLWAGNFDDMLPITKSVKLDKEAKANTPQLRAFKMLEDMTGTKRSINKVTYLLVKSQAGVFPVDEDLSPELVKSFSYWKSDEMPAPSYKDYWERQVLPPSMRILGVLKDFQQQKML